MVRSTRHSGREARRTRGWFAPLATMAMSLGAAWAYNRVTERLTRIEDLLAELADDVAEAHVVRNGARLGLGDRPPGGRSATDTVREVLAREAVEAEARADAEDRGTVRPLAGQRVRVTRPPQSA